MNKKGKQVSTSLTNLYKGKNDPHRISVKKQKEPQHTWFNPHIKNWVKDNWTSMQGTYSKQNPSPATKTKLHSLHTKVVLVITRIEKARPVKDARTVKESIMVLQFAIKFLHIQRKV